MLTEALTAEVKNHLDEKLTAALKENDDLRERMANMEKALIDHAHAIAALATIQGNTLKELKAIVAGSSRSRPAPKAPDDDIIN